MKVAGFTFIRNAVQNDYPIVEAITSILSICDEFIVAVGACDDGTLELIKNINSDKIKIVETVWDDNLREGGRVFAEETNKAFSAISPETDWCFYIQGDECVHEKYLETIKKEMELTLNNTKIEGLLFKYKHFYGSYDYFAFSRRWYKNEIRIIKNIKGLHSYKDAQGFRIDNRKINVKLIDAYIYHYGWVKPPKNLSKKMKNFDVFYNIHAEKIDNNKIYETFDYGNADELIKFKETHPKVMLDRIKKVNWKFNFDPTTIKRELKGKKKLMFWVEKTFGLRLFEYKNYKKV
jgi:sulfur relay (sulfurtransferase) DsrF/TusC family protein